MPLPVILFFLLLPILLWLFSTWDSLVRFEHDYFHQEWLEDGEPGGMFWRPSNPSRSFKSGVATQKLMIVWLFRNPEWADTSDDGMTLFKKYRVLFIAWTVSIVLWWLLSMFLVTLQ